MEAINYQDVYKGKKVFLTGHTGFKGCWLMTWLNLLGAEIMGYSLPPEPEHQLFEQIKGATLCESVFGNILDQTQLEKSILDFQPDFIFHLAAQAIVRTSYELPVETFEVNAIGTARLLSAVRKLEKPCIVVLITTDKVYHNNEWPFPYRENDRLGGYDPYSASKACAELVIDSYRNSYFNKAEYNKHQKSIVVARAGNVIGGGDWAKDRLIPDIARALQAGQEIPIRNPNAVRPWQHVLEPVNAYLLLGARYFASAGKLSSEYNFGPLNKDCLTVKEMVSQAIQIWGKGSYIVLDNSSMPHEAGLLKLETSRAAAELDWYPVFDAHQAIEKTISWYRDFYTDKSRLLTDDIIAFSKQINQEIQ